jgi:hypothetical protein
MNPEVWVFGMVSSRSIEDFDSVSRALATTTDSQHNNGSLIRETNIKAT